MRRFPLGSFPAMSISDARHAARAMHTKVKRDGVDPVADRRRDRTIGRAAKQGVGTLSALLALYGEMRAGELRTWAEMTRRVQSVFKSLLPHPLATLTATGLQMEADRYPAKQAAAAAMRYIRPVLKWAAIRGYVAPSVAVLRPPATVKRRNRTLSRDELRALLPALRASSRPYAKALQFMLLTLARREEVGQARWRDVDLMTHTWTIPAERSKNGQPHVVPLSRQAENLLISFLHVDHDRPREITEPDHLLFSTSNWRPSRELGSRNEVSAKGQRNTRLDAA